MSSDPERPASNSGDSLVHAPLPYLVRVRVVVDDDRPPEMRTIALTAYSMLEAMLQASLEAGGSGANDPRVTVEQIMPDLVAYQRLIEARLKAVAAKGY